MSGQSTILCIRNSKTHEVLMKGTARQVAEYMVMRKVGALLRDVGAECIFCLRNTFEADIERVEHSLSRSLDAYQRNKKAKQRK